MRTWLNECGAWSVRKAEWERLWRAADWSTRGMNDPVRARREFDALIDRWDA